MIITSLTLLEQEQALKFNEFNLDIENAFTLSKAIIINRNLYKIRNEEFSHVFLSLETIISRRF